MTPDPNDPRIHAVREAAKGPLHEALHQLDVRIANLKIDGCHCNLIAEVALDAIVPALLAAGLVLKPGERRLRPVTAEEEANDQW